MVRVSIITVCYNSEKTIRRTIESVLAQGYRDIEYILVDGLSSDHTVDIIREYEEKFEGRLRWISEKDHGIYDAMNKGISMAQGDLIGILNSDDYYESDAVQCMVDAMTEDKYQILYGYVRNCKDDVEYSVDRWSHFFLEERMIAHPSCFVTKTVYDDFGGFDLQYISVADYDFMLRMQQHSEIVFVPVDHIITNFALGGMSSSETAWMDLVKMRYQHGMMTEKAYRKEVWKHRIFQIIKRK